jgi:hypothetical protein
MEIVRIKTASDEASKREVPIRKVTVTTPGCHTGLWPEKIRKIPVFLEAVRLG